MNLIDELNRWGLLSPVLFRDLVDRAVSSNEILHSVEHWMVNRTEAVAWSILASSVEYTPAEVERAPLETNKNISTKLFWSLQLTSSPTHSNKYGIELCAIQFMHRSFSVFATHIGHKTTIGATRLLLVTSWIHDLHTCQRSVSTE